MPGRKLWVTAFVAAGLWAAGGCGRSAEEPAADGTSPWRDPAVQIKLLSERDTRVRCLAIRNLERMGADARSAIPALEKLRRDPNPKIQAAVAKALEKIQAD